MCSAAGSSSTIWPRRRLGKKSGNGLEAVKWWKQGLKEKVRDYCIDDVKITRELYDFAIKNGKSVKYKDYEGPREIKLDTITMGSPAQGDTPP